MQIDLKTVTIPTARNTFDHLARRFGDKPASRYQEGSYDIQAAENLHYRPTWDPEQELYDSSITKVVMKDWYALKDPRQFFYNTYTLTRARQQETAEANFQFVESRGLLEQMPTALQDKVKKVLLPLRHVAWGSNQNNTLICGYGYGVTFTQPCIYNAMDQLGIAQYLSRMGLLLGDAEALDEAKQQWLQAPEWQALRRYVEDTMAVRDPFELFVAQNVALDGLLYPLVYERMANEHLSIQGASAVAMLTQFMTDWYDESRKWVDSVIKTACAESDANRDVITSWVQHWSARAQQALLPIAQLGLDTQGASVLAEEVEAFAARLKKTGITL